MPLSEAAEKGEVNMDFGCKWSLSLLLCFPALVSICQCLHDGIRGGSSRTNTHRATTPHANKLCAQKGGMYNTHEGENFIPPGLASVNDTGSPPFNSSIPSFNKWLAGYLPGFSPADLDRVRELYPVVSSTETITSYNDTHTRAGLIYRDSVLACPAYWLAGAAPKGNYLGEYSISPATHGADTQWVRLPSSFSSSWCIPCESCKELELT